MSVPLDSIDNLLLLLDLLRAHAVKENPT
jgi:hypothetical protein